MTDTTRLCHSDCHYYSKYLGATEQREIDIEEQTREMEGLNKDWEETLAIQRKMLIGKACEWICKDCDRCVADIDRMTRCPRLNGFKKAMEE